MYTITQCYQIQSTWAAITSYNDKDVGRHTTIMSALSWSMGQLVYPSCTQYVLHINEVDIK